MRRATAGRGGLTERGEGGGSSGEGHQGSGGLEPRKLKEHGSVEAAAPHTTRRGRGDTGGARGEEAVAEGGQELKNDIKQGPPPSINAEHASKLHRAAGHARPNLTEVPLGSAGGECRSA